MVSTNTDQAYSRYFLIDYENVNRDGLNGIVKLSETDCVRIYYSDSAATMTFGLHRRINTSRAHFEYSKVTTPIKNAVDCQILFDIRDLFKLNRTAEFFIVSKDTDFDHAVSEFRSWGMKISKIPEICKPEMPETASSNPQSKNPAINKREAQIRSFFGQYVKEKEYTTHKEEIIRAVLTAKSKQQLNSSLMKIYPGKNTGTLYQKLKPLMEDLPSQ